MNSFTFSFPILYFYHSLFSCYYCNIHIFRMKYHYLKNWVMRLRFPFWFFPFVISYCSFLCSNQYSITNPANTCRNSNYLSIIKRNIDSLESYKCKIIKTNDDLSNSFNMNSCNCLDNGRAMIYILLLSIMVVAKEIASTYHKDEIIFYKQF